MAIQNSVCLNEFPLTFYEKYFWLFDLNGINKMSSHPLQKNVWTQELSACIALEWGHIKNTADPTHHTPPELLFQLAGGEPEVQDSLTKW